MNKLFKESIVSFIYKEAYEEGQEDVDRIVGSGERNTEDFESEKE